MKGSLKLQKLYSIVSPFMVLLILVITIVPRVIVRQTNGLRKSKENIHPSISGEELYLEG